MIQMGLASGITLVSGTVTLVVHGLRDLGWSWLQVTSSIDVQPESSVSCPCALTHWAGIPTLYLDFLTRSRCSNNMDHLLTDH